MSHPLSGICLKVIRAEEHLKTIIDEIAKCKDQCMIVKENDLDLQTVKLTATFSEPPLTLSIVAGECLHNLRSALDHLIWQLVNVNRVASAPTNRNQFPICSSESNWDIEIKGHRLDGVPATATAIIKQLQPYHFNPYTIHPLWWLSHLANVDKHRTLPLVFVSTQTALGDVVIDNADTVIWRGSLADAEKMEVEFKRGLSVAFKEIPTPYRLDAGKAVNVMLEFVRDNLIPRFKPFFR